MIVQDSNHTGRVPDQHLWVIDCTPQPGAVSVPTIVLDVYNEFIPHSCCMRFIADALDFNDKLVCSQQKVHPSCRSCIAWRELLRANIGDPGAELRMEQVLDVILGVKEQRPRVLASIR